jgi:hypothetical protein
MPSPARLPRQSSDGIRRFQQHIPPDVRVSAQDPFVPLPIASFDDLPISARAQCRITSSSIRQHRSWPLTADDVRVAQQRLAALGWRIAWQQDTTVIFQRTGTSEDLPW